MIENVSKITYSSTHVLAILCAEVCENQTFPASKIVFSSTIGTLSNYDDDSIENITKKLNLRPFKLYRVYLEPLNSLNVGDFSWS